MLRSYCETCKNDSCPDCGTRNIHFIGPNKCSNYTTQNSTNNQISQAMCIYQLLDLDNNLNKVPNIDEYVDDLVDFFINTATNNTNQLNYLANTISAIVWDSLNENLNRKLFMRQDLTNGQVGVINIGQNNDAYYITKDGDVAHTYGKQNYFCPPEYSLNCLNLISDKDIYNNKLLDKKYISNLILGIIKAFIRLENQITKTLLDETYCVYNCFHKIKPSLIADIRNQLRRWGTSPHIFIVGKNVLKNLLIEIDKYKTLANWCDFSQRKDLILNGDIGSILGTCILTDAHLHPDYRMLEDDECFMLSTPINFGYILQRQKVKCQIIDQRQNASKGLLLEQIQSQIIINTKSIVKGEINV